MKIDSQTIYIIIIVVFFNLLLLNIFRLQSDINNVSNNNKVLDKSKTKSTNKTNTDKIVGIDNNNYKKFNDKCNNNIIGNVPDKLNKLASLVPIDVNKIDDTDAEFISKFKQVETI
jgi:hypothetical protein